MRKLLLFSFLLLAGFPIFSQETDITEIIIPADSIITPKIKTVIYGSTTPERYGSTLELRATKDGITNAEITLANATVGSQGDFRFEFEPEFSGAVFIPLDAVNGFMFVEKDKTYQIELPPVQQRTRAERFDPYFRPRAMIVSIVEPDDNDVTVQISAFEDAFDEHYMRALTAGNRNAINNIITQLRRQTGVSKSLFVEDYKKFRYAILASILPNERPEWAISFINQTDVPSAYASPAFWEIFNLVFDNFFSAFPGGFEQQDFERAVRENNMEAMDAILETTFEIRCATLRQLVVIKGLMDLYNRDSGMRRDDKRRAYLLSILEEYSKSGLTERNREIAENVIARLKKTNVGERAYNFRLPDEQGRMHSLADFAGNYVYLHFVNAFITSSKRDLQVLSRYAQRFNNFKVINVFVYNSAEDLQQLAPEFKRGMTNLHWNNNAALLEEFEVRNIPTSYLIGPDGKFVFSPASSPGGDFEEQYSRMMREKEINRLRRQ